MALSRSRYVAACLLGGALVFAGCRHGEPAGRCVPVRGRVMLGDKPLAGGTVALVPWEGEGSAPRPEGAIDAQGLYAIRTAGKDGAPVGKYRAVVTTGGEDKWQDAAFNPVYSNWRNSPLVIEVTENAPPGAYDLKLTPRHR